MWHKTFFLAHDIIAPVLPARMNFDEYLSTASAQKLTSTSFISADKRRFKKNQFIDKVEITTKKHQRVPFPVIINKASTSGAHKRGVSGKSHIHAYTCVSMLGEYFAK